MRRLLALAATAALILPVTAAPAATHISVGGLTFSSQAALTAYYHGGALGTDVVIDLTKKHPFAAPAVAVPEPATWALMVMGLGSIGFALRRRQKSVSFS